MYIAFPGEIKGEHNVTFVPKEDYAAVFLFLSEQFYIFSENKSNNGEMRILFLYCSVVLLL